MRRILGNEFSPLRVWDFASRKETHSDKAHEGDVWSLAFSGDGRTLFSGDGHWGKPGQVKAWDLTTEQRRETWSTTGEVLAVACSPDGNTLAAGSADGMLKGWTVGMAAR